MQERRSFVLVLLLLPLISVSAQNGASQESARPVDGPGVFRNYCATCHGADGRGEGPAAKALKRDVPDLTVLARHNSGAFPAVHVRNTVMFGKDELLPAHGAKGMPMWGPVFHEIESDQDLGNVRLENLVKYLQSIQRK